MPVKGEEYTDTIGRVRSPTLKMRRFVGAYLGEADGNATKAAALAGYRNPRVAIQWLLASPWVKQQLDYLIKQSMSSDEVLIRLAAQASSDITDFMNCFEDRDDVIGVDKSGQPIVRTRSVINLSKVRKRNLGYLIKKITPTKFGDQVELYDAQAALAMMAKHHKLLVDRVEVGESVDLESLTDEELEKLAKRMK